MELRVLDDPESAARLAAATIASDARSSLAGRGRFTLAVSGGHTPWIMLRMLAQEEVAWAGVHIYQVDERIAPDADPDRNLTHIRENLLLHVPLPPDQFHAMPVNAADGESAAAEYDAELRAIAGTPPVLDLIHLGLGPDGHTASLVPGDAVLNVTSADVSLTGVYQGRRRMTLTYPAINRARRLLCLVTGSEKAQMLRRLVDGDTSIPAGRLNRERILVLADRAAAGQLMALRTGGR